MSKTIIMSLKRIEVFGPNKASLKKNQKGEVLTVVQGWNKKGKNRIQIKIGQQEVPTECLEWGMIKSMIDAKIITVGETTVDPAASKAAKAAAKVKTAADKKIADDAAKKAADEAKVKLDEIDKLPVTKKSKKPKKDLA